MRKKDFSKHLAAVERRKSLLKKTIEEVLSPLKRAHYTLEIGSGHGDFLNAYASQHPDKFCIGIDLVTKRVQKSQRKCQRAKLENLSFFKAKAEEFLECAPATLLFNEIIVLYPDPWPKRRHHKKRLFQPDFLDLLSRHAEKNASIYFQTDSEDYFNWTREMVKSHAHWVECQDFVPHYTVDTFFSRIMGQLSHSTVFKNGAEGKRS